ncbi:putative bifunctional diguanylate cyclase/phosphodiesterase [Mycolicibacterium helvum]|uniref:putative bifunctional diguanylate cyclase/phosphodiesterase n=1 Tax=Mycolicibacterium helvum TaxID=1534349 RepID=UPI0013D7C265|nr:bifunctional diguanylate cyclase/phosphodiesterase [Mycolicibacterium helvum]
MLAAVAATVATLRAATLTGGVIRAAWLSLAFGLGGFAVGIGARAWYALAGHTTAFSPAADLIRALLPAGACAALLLLSTGLSTTTRIRVLLDGVVVAGSIVIVLWAQVLGDIDRSQAAEPVPLAASMTYPILDAVVITVAVLVYLHAQPGQRMTIGLIALASLCIALTNDVVIHLFAARKTLDYQIVTVGWLAGLLLCIAAAVTGPSHARRDTVIARPPSPASVFLPFVPVAAASAVATFSEPPDDGVRGPLATAGALLIIAFLARQLIVVAENRRLFTAVTRQALRDPLTGLANRAVFVDRVGHAMQIRHRDGSSVGVMALDLDDFKMVNDTLGHGAGDVLLMLVAERLVATVRTGDTVARFGGDEFAVLIEGSPGQAQVIANRVAEAFDRPFVLGDRELIARPSFGLALAERDDHEITTAELLKRAAIALDAAKTSRVAGVHTFAPEMEAEFFGTGTTHSDSGSGADGERTHGVQLLGELRRAIDQGELALVYQPKVDLRTLEIVAVEALVRWPHPRRGVLAPDEFLPLVRRHGLMGAVTDLVVNKALDGARRWHTSGFDVPVAVNVSAPSLTTLRLVATVAAALAARGLDSSSLIIEITEDFLLNGPEQTKLVLHDLRACGIRIAIDDFGSGYSSLSYLRDLPIDHVKLNRHFIAPVTNDPRAAAVVRAVMNLAHELGMATVAEGIERRDTLEQLREYRCDFGQGYYFSRPKELDELLPMLANPPWLSSTGRSH